MKMYRVTYSEFECIEPMIEEREIVKRTNRYIHYQEPGPLFGKPIVKKEWDRKDGVQWFETEQEAKDFVSTMLKNRIEDHKVRIAMLRDQLVKFAL